MSLPAANTGATAHVTVCWLCCRGTWADGWMHVGRRTRKGKELKSDVKKEILVKVKKEQWGGRAWFEKFCGVSYALYLSG